MPDIKLWEKRRKPGWVASVRPTASGMAVRSLLGLTICTFAHLERISIRKVARARA